MNDKSRKNTIQIIKVFFNIAHILFWIAIGALIISAVLGPFVSEIRQDFCFIPIDFSIPEAPATFTLDQTEYTTTISRSSGRLMVTNGPLGLFYLSIFWYLIFLVISLFVIKKILHIIKRVEKREFFLKENADIVRKIAFSLLFLWFLQGIFRAVYDFFLTGNISSKIVKVSKLYGIQDIDNLALPLLIFIFAEVFRAGAALKEDQDLTI